MNRIIMEDVNNICEENIAWEKIKNKSVLITGATGYLATYIVLTLINRNIIYNDNILIYALCRNMKKAEKIYGELLKRNDIILLVQDVKDTIENVSNIDVVIHAASPANHYIHEKEPYKIVEANIFGLRNILDKCKEWKTEHIILFSSGAVYGNNTGMDPIGEDFRDVFDFCDDRNCYKLTKQMCEMMTICYKRENPQIKVNTVRPFIVYGPGQRYSQKKVFTDFVSNMLKDQDIEIKSDGKVVRSYIYIMDAIKAFFYVLLEGKDGVAYNITSTEDVYDVTKLANIFNEIRGYGEIKYIHKSDDYLKAITSCQVGKNSMIKLLGWKQETTIREGISRMIEWAETSKDFYE